MLALTILLNEIQVEIHDVSICFPGLLIILILGYVIIKEWLKRRR